MDSRQHNQVEANLPLHLIHHAFRRGGGMERCVVSLASSLRKLGKKIIVHTMKGDAALAAELGVELQIAPISEFPRKLQAYRFYRAMQRTRPQMAGPQIAFSRVRTSDILVCGGTHRGYLARTRKLAGPFDWLQFSMERQAYREPRVLVAHSELIANDLQKYYGISKEKIRVLYAPLDERFAAVPDAPGRAELRKKFGWPDEKVVFLFPSKGHRNKGLGRICEALEPFAEKIMLVVAGKPPTFMRHKFVSYLGFVEEIISVYRAVDFTTLGSFYESFGLVGPESILCGTRLVFERDIGCLPVINPELVFTFSARDGASIREAFSRAVALAETKQHHFSPNGDSLRYDPSPLAHAKAVLEALNCGP
ncbi:MAG TPA: glycosyltransferase family 4 protein [Candidatus Dormibacteraeota bacterium]|nr:glycosyltransferase family 4 protein [Candidatus Dormibacteraeota bacterium]